MEVQIKKTVKAGNSSAVILPRSWLNKEVRVELFEKTQEVILSEVIGILGKYICLESLIGIYLVGSYARGEEDESSDIDILVITDNIDKEMISEGLYNIFLISSNLLKHKLEHDLFPLGQMLRESKSLLNSSYLNLIKVKVTKNNTKWYLDTTDSKLRIINKIIGKYEKDNQKYVNDKVIYTLILRLRTLEIIKDLIKNKDYSNKDFIGKISRISGSLNPYKRYLVVKNNLGEKNIVSLVEARKLIEYLKNELDNVKSLVRS